jgi:hypothetical protein
MLPCVSVSGTRWNRCTPLLELERAKDAAALDLGDDLLVAPAVPALRDDLDAPPFSSA